VVALFVREAVGAGAWDAFVAVGTGFAQGVEHGADVGFGEGDDAALFGTGALDLAGEVGGGEAFGDGPGPQGGEAGVVVEEGFVGDGVLGGEEGFDVGFGDGVEDGIAGEVELEFAECVLVFVEGVLAESSRLTGQHESADDLGECEIVFGFHAWTSPFGLGYKIDGSSGGNLFC